MSSHHVLVFEVPVPHGVGGPQTGLPVNEDALRRALAAFRVVMSQQLVEAMRSGAATVGLREFWEAAMNTQPDSAPTPANKDAMAALKTRTISEGSDEPLSGEMCTICQEKFKRGDTVTELHCGHSFHRGCCLPWFEQHDTCPLCRKSVNEAHIEAQSKAQNDAKPGESTRVDGESGRHDDTKTTAAQPAPSAPQHHPHSPQDRLISLRRNLDQLPTRSLKRLSRRYNVNTAGCIERKDLVERIMSKASRAVPTTRVHTDTSDSVVADAKERTSTSPTGGNLFHMLGGLRERLARLPVVQLKSMAQAAGLLDQVARCEAHGDSVAARQFLAAAIWDAVPVGDIVHKVGLR